MRHYKITLGDVLQAHEEALTFGGRPGIANASLIESAIGRPYAGYYVSIYRKAAALLQSLATNHGFIDGNKRTAMLTVDLLIRQSAFRYRVSLDEVKMELEKIVLELVQHHADFDDTVDIFKKLIHPRRGRR